MKNSSMIILAFIIGMMTVGCDKGADSFSLLSSESSFKQNTSYVQRKIDILWVIDNSGSMETSQTNLANNFSSFINRFSALNYDFKMAVTSTDAYLAYHYNQNSRSKFKDGSGTNHSGVFVMDKFTPSLEQVFMKNITLGINGSGDERAFSSMEHTILNPLNAGFHRDGAFFAVIIVSDEDDFSHYDWQNGTSSYYAIKNYTDTSLFKKDRWISLLNTLTKHDPKSGINDYSVSAIAIKDEACRTYLNNSFSGRLIGTRYFELVDATGGVKGDLCGNFADSLTQISDKVIELATTFKLDREPYESTIQVIVDGMTVPISSTNGWTYDSLNWTITFHGNAIPDAGSDVRVYYDPKNVKL